MDRWTVPTANHVVNVDPGHVVTISNTTAQAYTLAIHGTLRFSTTVNTRLRVTNLMVMGDHGMPSMTYGRLSGGGNRSNPIASNVTAEIVIANSPTGSGVSDPEQFGTGILNFGKMTVHGSVKNPTFVRVAVEPRRGPYLAHACSSRCRDGRPETGSSSPTRGTSRTAR